MLLAGCSRDEARDRVYDEGVSWELAQLRKQEIKNLKYALAFSIPELRHDAVEGEACIRFDLQHRQEVILDFRESADKIKSLSVNGCSVEYAFLNGHIIIPRKATVKGGNEVHILFAAGEQSLTRND